MAEMQIQSADYIVPVSSINLPATLASSASAYSGVIAAQGYHAVTASILSSQNGTLSIQRYLDPACTMPQGIVASTSITAGVQATVNLPSDGSPFEYLQVTVSNSGGSTANLSNALVVLSPVSGVAGEGGATGTVSATANTTGGTSSYFNAALGNTVSSVKSSAGNLYGFTFQNPNSTAAYVQLFDLVSNSVTLGTTAPKLSYWVPAGGSYDLVATGEAKISFATAISIAATTTATGSTTPSVGVLTNMLFK
jgi:hypothetical protein